MNSRRLSPPRRPYPTVIAATTLLLLCLAAPAVLGAGRAGEEAADFPPGEFTDGGRHSLEDLRGKAVVLYFYEKD